MPPLIFYKSDHTGGAWWPVDIKTAIISFEDEQIYKIDGRTFKADTMVFRIAWEQAMQDFTWDAITKKGPQ